MSVAGKVSAGILPYRRVGERFEVLIIHPGGPLWAGKDAGAWSIAKGELDPGESPAHAAVRELREETGWEVVGPLIALGSVVLKSGKTVHGFGAALDVDPATLRSGTFQLEWPRGSGLRRSFPEVDRAAWLDPTSAKAKLNPAQGPLVDRLVTAVAAMGRGDAGR
ncbi:MAG: NUDIX domain-containing protein [Myxococcota bacterium]